ncbi:MAG: TRAP transporter large permease [Burkholderiaceae bacterium]
MSGAALGLAMFAAMLVMMAVRVPIAVAMFVPGAIGYWAMTSDANLLALLKGSAVARLSVYDLSVIPLFLLMGQFASHGGLSRALFEAATAFVGHVRGGLAIAAVLAGAAFGAVCGSSVATSATIAQVAYPEMRRLGYSGRLSTATLACSGTMGILIPPSVPLVVYAILTEQSIARLFAAALVPGLLAVLGYVVVIMVWCRLRPDMSMPAPRMAWRRRFAALVGVWPIAAIFVAVFGGIYGGVFTPTEGAAVGAIGTFVAGAAAGDLRLKQLKLSFLGAAETSAMVFMIFLGADMMNSALALTRMPADLAQLITQLDLSPIWVIAGILVFYVLLGCVMDELSMIMLTIPVLFPSVIALELMGLGPQDKAIWFGVLVLGVVGIGLVAPPIGLNVYVVNALCPGVPMMETYKGVLHFLISDVLRMIVLLAFPAVTLAAVWWLF